MSAQINANYLNRIREIKSKILSELKGTKEKVENFQNSKKTVNFNILSNSFNIDRR